MTHQRIYPVAYLNIYPNPVDEGEEVTVVGYGRDYDGRVVECQLIYPSGRIIVIDGDSLKVTLRSDEVESGVYRLMVIDNDGLSSDTSVSLELKEVSDFTPWIAVAGGALAMLVIGKVIQRMRHSKPEAWVFINGAFCGRTPLISEFVEGLYEVTFKELGYIDCTKTAKIVPNKTTDVYCELKKIPKIELKLSAKPEEVLANGLDKSVITVKIVDENDRLIIIPRDVDVELKTSLGEIESPIKIEAGKYFAKTYITSDRAGNAVVEARIKTKLISLEGKTEVKFL